MLCIKETKLEFEDDFVCQSLWGYLQFWFYYRPSIKVSRGILTLWDVNEVEVWVIRNFDNALIIQGCFLGATMCFLFQMCMLHLIFMVDKCWGQGWVAWLIIIGMLCGVRTMTLTLFSQPMKDEAGCQVVGRKIYSTLTSLLMKIFYLIFLWVGEVLLGIAEIAYI